jgi:hypothetical protein
MNKCINDRPLHHDLIHKICVYRENLMIWPNSLGNSGWLGISRSDHFDINVWSYCDLSRPITICLDSGFSCKICIILVGLEVLTVVTKVFWIVSLCSWEKTWHLRALLDWLTLQPWSWRWYFPLKCPAFSKLHGIITHKTITLHVWFLFPSSILNNVESTTATFSLLFLVWDLIFMYKLKSRVRFPEFQILWEAGLERGTLSLVKTTEELLEGKVAAPV